MIHETPSDDLRTYTPDGACLIGRFAHQFLINGRWQVLGTYDGWDRNVWPIPAFGRKEGNWYFKVVYPKNNPNGVPTETRIDLEAFKILPEDSLSGAGRIEQELAILFSDGNRYVSGISATITRGQTPLITVDHFLYFPTKSLATLVAKQLQEQGYTVTITKSNRRWLLLVSHDAVSSAPGLDSIIEELEKLAVAVGGDYHGYERGVRQ